MKKTLIFLLTLSLTLSGAISNKLDKTLKHIIEDLRKINESTPPIKFSPDVSHNISRKHWRCNTSREILKELNVVLHKVKADELSQTNKATLKTVQQNLKTVEDFFLRGQSVTGEKTCPNRRSCERPLECYIKILQCLYRNCSVTSMPR